MRQAQRGEAPPCLTTLPSPFPPLVLLYSVIDGAYVTWDDLQADLELMCRNCMTYNVAGSIYYLEGQRMLTASREIIKLGRQGKTKFRGRMPGFLKAHDQVRCCMLGLGRGLEAYA